MRKEFILTAVLVTLILTDLSALPRSFKQFQEIEELFAKQNYTEAVQRYERFIVEYPDSEYVPQAYYHRAISLYKIDFPESALEMFRFIEKRYRDEPFAPEISYWKGICRLTLNDFSAAVEDFEQYRKRSSTNRYKEKSYFYTVRTLAKLHQFERTEEAVSRFFEDYPQSELRIEAALHYTDILLQKGETSRVIRFTEWVRSDYFAEENDENREQLDLYRAEAYRLNQSIERAKEIYARLKQGTSYIALIAYNRLYFIALKQEESDTMETLLLEVEGKFSGRPELLMGFWLQAGIESFDRGELDLSEYFLTRVWSIRDKTAIPQEAPLILAEIYREDGDQEKAIQILLDYSTYAGTPPPQIHVKLGNLYFAEKEFLKAAEQFSAAIKLSAVTTEEQKAREEAFYHGAAALENVGRYEKALSSADEGLAEYPEGRYTRELMNTKINILWKSNRFSEAEKVLISYLDLYPDDISRRVDLEKLLAIQKKYTRLLTASSEIARDFPALDDEYPELFPVHSFLTGVAAYEESDYSLSADSFEHVPEAFNAGYYYGYSLYRIGQYAEALVVLSDFTQQNPDHADYQEALYTAGLSAMEIASFDEAFSFFSTIETERNNLSLKADFNRGLCRKKQNQYNEAAGIFKELSNQQKNTDLAETAMIQYAEVLGLQGNIEESVGVYREFPEKFTKSPLRDEALIKLALLYHANERYERAKEVCLEYERLFPEGKFIDTALYYAADSALKSGSPTEGILLWEKLIIEHPESRYRAAALRNSAEVYAERDDYREALEQYELLVREYSQIEDLPEIKRRITTLRYQIGGDTEQIAELKSTITHAERAQSETGRKAMLELAEIYIFDVQGNTEEVYSLVTEIQGSNFPRDSAEAQYLLGEYYAQKKEYAQSTEAFLAVPEMSGAEEETAAKSLYRGAETARTAGKDGLVQDLISRLRAEYPASRWTKEAEKLLEG